MESPQLASILEEVPLILFFLKFKALLQISKFLSGARANFSSRVEMNSTGKRRGRGDLLVFFKAQVNHTEEQLLLNDFNQRLIKRRDCMMNKQ